MKVVSKKWGAGKVLATAPYFLSCACKLLKLRLDTVDALSHPRLSVEVLRMLDPAYPQTRVSEECSGSLTWKHCHFQGIVSDLDS